MSYSLRWPAGRLTLLGALAAILLFTAWNISRRTNYAWCGDSYGLYLIDGALDWGNSCDYTDRPTQIGLHKADVNYDMGFPQSRLPLLPLAIAAALMTLIACLPTVRQHRILDRWPFKGGTRLVLAFGIAAMTIWAVSQFRSFTFSARFASVVFKFGDAMVQWKDVTDRLDYELGPLRFDTRRLPVRGCTCCERATYGTYGSREFEFNLAWIFTAAFVLARLGGLRRQLVVQENRCIACGYSLRGLTTARCPECGHVTSSTVSV